MKRINAIKVHYLWITICCHQSISQDFTFNDNYVTGNHLWKYELYAWMYKLFVVPICIPYSHSSHAIIYTYRQNHYSRSYNVSLRSIIIIIFSHAHIQTLIFSLISNVLFTIGNHWFLLNCKYTENGIRPSGKLISVSCHVMFIVAFISCT